MTHVYHYLAVLTQPSIAPVTWTVDGVLMLDGAIKTAADYQSAKELVYGAHNLSTTRVPVEHLQIRSLSLLHTEPG